MSAQFREGERVRMWSGCFKTGTKFERASRLLRGVVEEWPDGRHVVRWDDWPLVTELPNPNVESDA